MLTKIISIKNVGRFQNYGATGEVGFKRYSLVFAENGRGKTTLCAILRSLQAGEADHVIGRTTLGGNAPPEVNIRLEGGNAIFTNGAWNVPYPDIAIFDATFVAENVHSGDAVDLEHRRNLYRVIIGKEGVALARAVDEADAKIKEKTAELRDRRTGVQLHAPTGMPLEEFIPLPAEEDVDTKILDKQREFDAIRQSEQIRSRPALAPLALPSLPPGLDDVLPATVEGLGAEAVQRVTEHLAVHGMKDRGEGWLSQGRTYVRGDSCPFCAQTLEGASLIAAYNGYFSAGYEQLRRRISALRSAVDAALGDRAIAQVDKAIDANNSSADFWERYCRITRPRLAGDAPELALRSLRVAALRLIDRKASSPLERLEPDQGFTDALAAVGALDVNIKAYNAAVAAANALVAAKKTSTQTGEPKSIEVALRRLEAIKARYQPHAIAAIDAHEAAAAAKKALEDEKAAARTTLDSHTAGVIGRYENTINLLLDDFQAGFRITRTTHDYRGGVPSSSFQILINETPVELGDADSGIATPTFRNTLSAGDKSTLALAFFLAQLHHDPDCSKKVVVFDDPFNSQDAFRKDHTVAKIKKCGQTARQVIVLSHDRSFLKRIWDRLDPAERRAMRLQRIGQRNTTIVAWDIEVDSQDRFKADQKALADYYNDGTGSPRDTVNKIRPVLETYCRTLYPSLFLETDMLGGIVGKIRAQGAAHPLASVADDIDILNDYTKRYHHGEGTNTATEPIDDDELQGFVKKTMMITGSC